MDFVISAPSAPLMYHDRWRPFEAALAACGSVSEDILECLEDEEAYYKLLNVEVSQLKEIMTEQMLYDVGLSLVLPWDMINSLLYRLYNHI